MLSLTNGKLSLSGLSAGCCQLMPTASTSIWKRVRIQPGVAECQAQTLLLCFVVSQTVHWWRFPCCSTTYIQNFNNWNSFFGFGDEKYVFSLWEENVNDHRTMVKRKIDWQEQHIYIYICCLLDWLMLALSLEIAIFCGLEVEQALAKSQAWRPGPRACLK